MVELISFVTISIGVMECFLWLEFAEFNLSKLIIPSPLWIYQLKFNKTYLYLCVKFKGRQEVFSLQCEKLGCGSEVNLSELIFVKKVF